MQSFVCLYFLENFYMYIIEVKRTGLSENINGIKNKWLQIDKETLEITPLTFRSMDSSEEIEERYFEEGFLKFNINTGTYIEKFNSAQHPLDYRKEFKISTALINAVDTFLANDQAL